jgi:hypothetical protein
MHKFPTIRADRVESEPLFTTLPCKLTVVYLNDHEQTCGTPDSPVSSMAKSTPHTLGLPLVLPFPAVQVPVFGRVYPWGARPWVRSWHCGRLGMALGNEEHGWVPTMNPKKSLKNDIFCKKDINLTS